MTGVSDSATSENASPYGGCVVRANIRVMGFAGGGSTSIVVPASSTSAPTLRSSVAIANGRSVFFHSPVVNIAQRRGSFRKQRRGGNRHRRIRNMVYHIYGVTNRACGAIKSSPGNEVAPVPASTSAKRISPCMLRPIRSLLPCRLLSPGGEKIGR